MAQGIWNTILLNHCCCNFAMLLDTFVELFWKLQLLQVFVAVLWVLWPPCLGDSTSIFDTHLNGLLLHGHFLPLQVKQMLQCTTGTGGLHSWKQKMRLLFISCSGWQPFKTAEMPMRQSTRGSFGGCHCHRWVNVKCQRNSWMSFICLLIRSIIFVADACFLYGVCFGGVYELILIHYEDCLWTCLDGIWAERGCYWSGDMLDMCCLFDV